jgi:hypothetical protein
MIVFENGFIWPLQMAYLHAFPFYKLENTRAKLQTSPSMPSQDAITRAVNFASINVKSLSYSGEAFFYY